MELTQFMKDNLILSLLAPPYTPQINSYIRDKELNLDEYGVIHDELIWITSISLVIYIKSNYISIGRIT